MKHFIGAACMFVFSCLYGQIQPVSDSVPAIVVKNLGNQINSEFIDYAPLVSADGSMLIYTSRKPVSRKKSKNPKDRIYRAQFDCQKGEWQDGIPYSKTLNVPEQNNSTVYVSDDAQMMLIYRDEINTNGDIFISRLIGYEWTEPESIGEPVNSFDRELSACLSSDRKTMYFVSDRPGGKGGLDIWYTEKDSLGQWKAPVNMGAPINTAADEDGISFHQGGKVIFFSSNGHNTIGGFDVFMSVLSEASQTWSEPVSLGSQINTPDDDLYFTMEASGKKAYYSSVRLGGYGKKDVYEVDFKESLINVDLTLIKGRIMDKNNRVLESRIVVTNKTTQKVVYNYSPNVISGKYLLTLPSGSNYELKVMVHGYDDYIYRLNNKNHIGYKEIVKDFIMDLPHESPEDVTQDTTLLVGKKPDTRDSSQLALETIALALNKDTTIQEKNALAALGSRSLKENAKEMKEPAGTVSEGNTVNSNEEALIAKAFIDEKIQKNDGPENGAGEAWAYIKQVIGKEYKIPEEVRYTADTLNASVIGKVVDANGNPLKVQIEVIDSKSKQVLGTYSNTITSGAFGLKLQKGTYRLIFSKNCYLFNSFFITVSGDSILNLKEIAMEQLQNGKKIVLDNILFDYTKAKIRTQSYFTLDRTVYLLKSNPTLKIEIAGHTDNTYSAELNQKLSEERAKAVMDYLVQKGIDQQRLTFRGYGYSQPVASNETKAGRQLNRRTELKVLGENLKSEQTREITRMKQLLSANQELNKKISTTDASNMRFKQFDSDGNGILTSAEVSAPVDLFLTNNAIVDPVEIIALVDFYLEK